MVTIITTNINFISSTFYAHVKCRSHNIELEIHLRTIYSDTADASHVFIDSDGSLIHFASSQVNLPRRSV